MKSLTVSLYPRWRSPQIPSPSLPSVMPPTKDSSPLGPILMLHWSVNTCPNRRQRSRVTLTNSAKTSAPPSPNPNPKQISLSYYKVHSISQSIPNLIMRRIVCSCMPIVNLFQFRYNSTFLENFLSICPPEWSISYLFTIMIPTPSFSNLWRFKAAQKLRECTNSSMLTSCPADLIQISKS